MFSKVIAKIFAIEQLTVNDVAFVQRSNGEWQYSVVVEAASDTNYCEEQCNTLSVNSRGCTKTIPKRRWVQFIRLVRHHDDQKFGKSNGR
jgi:hypothetical protein